MCVGPLASCATLCSLPCTNTVHASCVEGLRSVGIQQVCLTCHVELPPGPGKLHEEAARRFCDVARRVNRGKASWGAPTKSLEQEVNEVLRLWRSAAGQGYAEAQSSLGTIQSNIGFCYFYGEGAQKSPCRGAAVDS